MLTTGAASVCTLSRMSYHYHSEHNELTLSFGAEWVNITVGVDWPQVADFGLIKLLQPIREECPEDDCCCTWPLLSSCSPYRVTPKLQASVYDILPLTTTGTGYVPGLQKLSYRQFFLGAQNWQYVCNHTDNSKYCKPHFSYVLSQCLCQNK